MHQLLTAVLFLNIMYITVSEAGLVRECYNVKTGSGENLQSQTVCEYVDDGFSDYVDNNSGANPGGYEPPPPPSDDSINETSDKSKKERCLNTANGKYQVCKNNSLLAGAMAYNECWDMYGHAGDVVDYIGAVAKAERKCNLAKQTMLTATSNECEINKVNDLNVCARI